MKKRFRYMYRLLVCARTPLVISLGSFKLSQTSRGLRRVGDNQGGSLCLGLQVNLCTAHTARRQRQTQSPAEKAECRNQINTLHSQQGIHSRRLQRASLKRPIGSLKNLCTSKRTLNTRVALDHASPPHDPARPSGRLPLRSQAPVKLSRCCATRVAALTAAHTARAGRRRPARRRPR